jgi:hypothetical protein
MFLELTLVGHRNMWHKIGNKKIEGSPFKLFLVQNFIFKIIFQKNMFCLSLMDDVCALLRLLSSL